MKRLIIFTGFFLLSAPVSAEPPAAPAVPNGEQEIERAFQREYAYLVAQREALLRQRQRIDSRTAADVSAARRSLQELGSRLARTQAGNDSLFAGVQDAERIRREERNREDQLALLWKKGRRALEETRFSLRFEPGKPETELLPPEILAVADLARLGEEAVALAASGARLARFRGSYLDAEDRLVEGSLFRLGRIAVFAESESGVKLLGPNGKGALRVVENDKAGAVRGLLDRKSEGNVPVYLFESLQDRLSVKKPAGFLDRAADSVPLIFLALLFLMVAFLFAQLARA